MGEFVKLKEGNLEKIRDVNERLVSYNVEITEVTGGTFWKAYTDAQIDGTEQVPPPDFSKGGNPLAAMHQWYDPIDTTNPRLRKLAKELGSCWVRENYPECLIVGPSDTDPMAMQVDPDGKPYILDQDGGSAGIAEALPYCSTGELLDGCTEKLDVFSYHYYNGVSERMAAMMPSAFIPAEGAMSEEYLGMAGVCASCFAFYRDRYCPGAHVFAHSRKDGKDGVAYLVINTSWTEATTVELPKAAEVYALTGNGKMRSRTMLLNGKELILGENDEIPELNGVTMEGTVEVAPGGCVFFVL